MDQPFDALLEELIKREVARDPEQFRVERKVDRSEPGMSPHTLATLGGLADAASTYAFMKRGTMREMNPLVDAIARGNPEMTGLTVLAGLAATKGITKLIGKKWPRVADALAANLGAQQLSMGTRNTANTFKKNEGRQGSFGAYGDTMIRSGIEQSHRNTR